MKAKYWDKIYEAIFTVEIQLDSAVCDKTESDDTREWAERYLSEVTSLRKRMIKRFGVRGNVGYGKNN